VRALGTWGGEGVRGSEGEGGREAGGLLLGGGAHTYSLSTLMLPKRSYLRVVRPKLWVYFGLQDKNSTWSVCLLQHKATVCLQPVVSCLAVKGASGWCWWLSLS